LFSLIQTFNFRYDEANNELVNEKLNIAYPIENGIPNMNPNNARMIKKDTEDT
jgi:uncharacterized protein YbaR (Trm112 family)